MTKKQFIAINNLRGFEKAMQCLNEECDEITDYETLKTFVIKQIEADNNMLALHIWNAVYNSHGDSQWYHYDYCAGTTHTPKCLNNLNDVLNLNIID